MRVVSVAEVLSKGQPGDEAELKGWIRTRRDAKAFSFIEINDGSCLKNIQVLADQSLPEYEQLLVSAQTGASVIISGVVTASAGSKQRVEIKANTVKVVGEADPESYPLQKKRHSFEFLRTIGHLRPRSNTFGAVFRVRSAASFAIHKFFNERGFVYLHTPIITTSDCEGAGKVFQVTTLDLNNLPKKEQSSGKVDFSQDFFGREAILTVSGQLEAECFACALGKVYTFGPTFRAENSNTPRHLAEFWMVEPEMAFFDLAANAELAEDFLKYVIAYVLENCAEDMEFFDQWIQPGVIKQLAEIAGAEFARITYTEAIDALQKANKKFEYQPEWGIDIQTEHERYLSEEYLKRPVFVTNYPKEIKAFYMRLDEGGQTVSAMDLLVPRLGEIIGGSQREEREDVLRHRIKELGLNEENFSWYLDLRRYGTIIHSGFGLGFERLIMYLTGMANIRDVIPFARTPGNADF